MKTFVDLFAGIGGFRVALERQGLKCVFSSEIDKKAQIAYFQNFGDEAWGDIRLIHAAEIPPHDILCAGFPCQSFSLSGYRKSFSDRRGRLFFEIIRIAKHHNPKIILMENVPGILHAEKGEAFKRIYSEIEASGYKMNHYLLNSGFFGIPQSRKRIYFVAIRDDLPLSSFRPVETYEKIFLKDILLPDAETAHLIKTPKVQVSFSHKSITNGDLALQKVGQFWRGKQGACIYSPEGLFPTICSGSSYETVLVKRELKPLQVGKIGKGRQYEKIFSDQGTAYSICSNGHDKYAISVKEGQMKPIQVGTIKTGGQGSRIYADEGHSVCLMSSGGGGGALTGYYQTSGVIRKLHINECKILMGFAISHIVAPGEQGYRQLGNSVIPKMVELVYCAINLDREKRDAPRFLDHKQGKLL